MVQIFHESANTFARASLLGFLLFVITLGGLGVALDKSPYSTGVKVPVSQPVPFSHRHHVSGLGLDCRFCHLHVEDSAFAGLPATEICMKCHSHLWTNAALLEPVRNSLRTGQPIRWNRVHDVPDHAFFNHSIHVKKGIGCSTCHGRVDEMHLVHKSETLHMEWCLACHRNPERHIRAPDEVFNMDVRPERRNEEERKEILAESKVDVVGLTDCSVCHR